MVLHIVHAQLDELEARRRAAARADNGSTASVVRYG
jgi:hypothetical protein